LCSKPWETHDNHFKCPTYNVGEEGLQDKPEHIDEDEFTKKQRAVEDFNKLDPRKRLLLQKFTRYYPMFADIAKTMETEVVTGHIEDKIDKLMKLRAITDVTFLRNAFLAVKMGRESLKYTYIHLAFLSQEANLDMFQHLQDTLKMCLKNLAQAVNVPPADMDISLVKKYTKATNSTLEHLLQHVGGMEEIEYNKKKKGEENEKEDKDEGKKGKEKEGKKG